MPAQLAAGSSREAHMPHYVVMLQELARNVEAVAGAEVCRAVMAGSEEITDSSSPAKVALWIQGAMARLDELADEETRRRTMACCGQSCAALHKSGAEKRRAMRRRCATIDEFLAAEERDPSPGTRLERAGDVIYQYYTPRSYSRPMRCFCSLVKGLPEAETVSPTYCECSRGFVEWTWELILGRPVQVEVIETCMTGASECKFAIRL
jgi:hypothetical protein